MEIKKFFSDVLAADKKKSMPVLSFPAISLMDITVEALISDADKQARGMKLICDRVDSLASVSMMDLSVEAEAFGAQIRVSEDEVPTVIGQLIPDPEAAEALKVPPADKGRAALYVRAIKKAKELITDRPVFAGVIGPVSLTGRLMDMTEMMVNFYAEPEMVHTVLEKATEFIIAYINEYKKVGADGVVMAEPAAGLLSPDLNREFSAAYVKRIIDAVRDDNFGFIYHNCGNVIPLMPDLLDFKADAYHFGNAIDIAEALKIMPSDVLVMGNIDPSGQFRNGTPESIRAKTLELLGRCSGYKNFVISSGCDIPPLTPWENIDAYFAAVSEFYK